MIETGVRRRRFAPRRLNGARAWPYLFLLPFFLGYITFQLFPLLYSFVISLTNWDGIGQMKFIGLKNYADLFTTDPYFLKSIFNTVILIVFYIPVVMAFGVVTAVLLHDEAFRGRRFFQVANFLPFITTPVALGILFNILFDWQTGIVNRVLESLGLISDKIDWFGGHPFYTRFVIVLVLVWQNFGYYMTMYLAGLAGISPDIYEAATMDGANRVQTFFHITLPMLRPVTLFLLVTSIISGMQLFDQPMLLLNGTNTGYAGIAGGPNRTALTAMWNFFDTAFGANMRYGRGAAISYSLFLFIAAFSFVGYKINARKDADR